MKIIHDWVMICLRPMKVLISIYTAQDIQSIVGFVDYGRIQLGLFLFSLLAKHYKHLSNMYNIHSDVLTECKMSHDFPVSLFSLPTGKQCNCETNCCVALALQ